MLSAVKFMSLRSATTLATLCGGNISIFFDFIVISLGRVVVPSPKIVINLPGTYEKLPCYGEPDRFSG